MCIRDRNNIYVIYIDCVVGHLKQKDVPEEYFVHGTGIFKERFRRMLCFHKDFAEGLSARDRSALISSNTLIVGALALVKVR